LRTLEAFDASQLLEDPEARVAVFPCTGRFARTATATRVKVAAVVGEPGTVGAVGKLEADHVSILHRATILSAFGVDLESSVRIVQPVVSSHRAGDSVNTKNIRKSLGVS